MWVGVCGAWGGAESKGRRRTRGVDSTGPEPRVRVPGQAAAPAPLESTILIISSLRILIFSPTGISQAVHWAEKMNLRQ